MPHARRPRHTIIAAQQAQVPMEGLLSLSDALLSRGGMAEVAPRVVKGAFAEVWTSVKLVCRPGEQSGSRREHLRQAGRAAVYGLQVSLLALVLLIFQCYNYLRCRHNLVGRHTPF